MVKKVSKILVILLVVMIAISAFVPVFGAESLLGEVEPTTTGNESLWNIGNSFLGIVKIVGILIAVGMLIVLGIRYVIASANDKAEIKKSAVGFIIGAIVIFAAVGILQMVETIANNAVKQKTTEEKKTGTTIVEIIDLKA